MEKSKIDWTDSSWNPVTGCLHGCKYCYAHSIANRFDAKLDTKPSDVFVLEEPVTSPKGWAEAYPYGFAPTLYKYRLDQPEKWKRGRKIFVCSMADLFGEWVPDEWIKDVFKSCKEASQHEYLFLTKNPKRYLELEEAGILPHQDNMWFGTSLTKKDDVFMWLDKSVKSHFFISVEPILEPFGEMSGKPAMPEWIIIGAETGNRKGKAIPKRAWIEKLLNEGRKHGIPVFMKSSLLDIWGESLIQEYPERLKTKDF